MSDEKAPVDYELFSCLGCLGVSVVCFVVLMLAAVAESIFANLFDVLLMYLWVAVFSLAFAPMLDMVSLLFFTVKKVAQRKASVSSSFIPRHNLLLKTGTIDSALWQMIDYYIGRKTVTIRNMPLIGSSIKNKKIQAYIELREKLLHDEWYFRAWITKKMIKVIDFDRNKSMLLRIYNVIWILFKKECQEGSGRLSSAIVPIISLRKHRDTFFVTRHVVFFLSFTLVDLRKNEREDAKEPFSETLQNAVLPYLADGNLFRDFLHEHLFQILCEIDLSSFFDEGIRDSYHTQRETEQHYTLIPATSSGDRLLPQNIHRSLSPISSIQQEKEARMIEKLQQIIKEKDCQIRELELEGFRAKATELERQIKLQEYPAEIHIDFLIRKLRSSKGHPDIWKK